MDTNDGSNPPPSLVELDKDILDGYKLLVEQLHKYSAILWQFPLALFVANALLFTKVPLSYPLLLAAGVADALFAYVFHRLVSNQLAIVEATRATEGKIRLTKFCFLVPEFRRRKGPSGLIVLQWLVWGMAVGLIAFSLAGLFNAF